MPETTTPRVHEAPRSTSRPIPAQRTTTECLAGSLVVDGLVVESPNRTRLLDGVGFAVPAGTLLGVAGPTGSGKTTLARALTGALAISAGSVEVGGYEVGDLDASRRGIGHVPQEDALHPELSVRRTLTYAAALRMPGDDAAARLRSVEAVIEEVRLSGQADLSIGALSVGQRKRVCIAIEMLSRPAVLVLDEPTSSLDPGYEGTVMATLRRLADAGHVIVVATHSQAVLAGCDRVALLASGGWLAYFGAPSQMHEHFGTASAAELFSVLDQASPLTGAHPHDLVRRQPRSGARPTEEPRPGLRRQLATLTHRYLDLTFADRRRTWLFAAQVFVLGGLLAMFVAPHGLARPVGDSYGVAPVSATGMAVLMVMCVTWLGMSSAVREIVKERQVLVREHRAGLSALAYVGSKLTVLGPLLTVQAAAVTVLAVQRQDVPGSGAALPSALLELVVAMALVGVCAVSLALFVSAVVRTADKAIAVLPMLVVVEFVLSGLTPSVSWAPGLAQLRDVAATRWAVQAVEATVTGDAHSWWTAVGAMSALIALALAGTFVAVHRSLRLPSARRHRRSLREAAGSAFAVINPEMRRLSRAGAVGLAAVALVVCGARVIISAESRSTPPLLAASAAPTGSTEFQLSEVASAMPGVLGDLWWVWDAGTRFSIDMTEAAYLVSSFS